MAFSESLSASSMRPPLTSADAPSMADSLPNIDFGFEDLRQRMNNFTARFDEFIKKGRERVLEERNQFRVNVAELQEDQRQKQRDIEILTLKQSQHQQTLAKETQETTEMHTAIAKLSTRRDDQLAHRDALLSQLQEIQQSISVKRDAQAKHARYLDSQARFNAPELEFWQDCLCMRIDGAGLDDRLKFVYTHVDERDWENEAWFELDMGAREYRIVGCRPKIENEEVERVLERLNESRELSVFLKGMRELFVEALK
ncbi:hypothetical protein K490DRAFT_51199 [Saccharata proteae CBS 121410]|uniref:Kinetochore protein SPC25 n=1 Tax=Saccharata proteae CBS 121410 TaxID=1314787 RepID=A0A9P4HL67_9PEZI|nr:hypothetical protein K490DRAFT_51199 [Saccharata proteae CBS 121410]